MQSFGTDRSDASSVLDAFASRLGFVVSVGALFLLCVLAGLRVEISIRHLEADHQVFSDRQLRNGFVSMSDIQRVLLVAQEAEAERSFSEQTRADFIEAVDILYVRKDNFQRVLRAGETLASAQAAISALETVIAIADDAIANNFTSTETLLADLLEASDLARVKLVSFLDDMDRMQNIVLRNQADAVQGQRNVVYLSLGGLTLLGFAALLLLRREVLARRAWERAERDVEFLAYYDPLTRLPNRTQFHKRLGAVLATNRPVALILVDLDDFKGINDTYGHTAGDGVLRCTATLLSNRAEELNGFAARLGGDEFAIVVPTDNLERLNSLCHGLLQDIADEFDFDGEAIAIRFSIGLATNAQLGTNLCHTVDTLTRVTDFALYASKTHGRGRFTLYDQTLEQQYLERRAMIEELPRAIGDDALEIYFQPKVLLRNAEVYGFEALVRWHRNGNVIPPNEFITVAEESGVIIELDRYMLRSSAALVAEFNRKNGTAYSVSVNLSALHFSSRRIVGTIQEALEGSRLCPKLLTVEITETVELRDWRLTQKIISAIRSIGVKVSIDDFGTGYSSLSYLRTTMADELKIDRSLVEQIETSEKARFLLDGVLDMAHSLKMDVVVEGIETEPQAQTVASMGAARAQGYLYGRPVPAETAMKRALTSFKEAS
ncbi:MAG: bifunctional diguanylate cyclase/phosphodiesterase [Pseudomonadota bacterium]